MVGLVLCFQDKLGKAFDEAAKQHRAELQRAEAREQARDHRAGYEAMVCLGVQDRVREQLLAPSTADFQDCAWGHTTEYQGNGDYLVRFYVDAQNGFGAKIRQYFDAEAYLSEPTPHQPVVWSIRSLTHE